MSVFIVLADGSDIERVYDNLDEAKTHDFGRSHYVEIQEWEVGRNIFKNVWFNNGRDGWKQNVNGYLK